VRRDERMAAARDGSYEPPRNPASNDTGEPDAES